MNESLLDFLKVILALWTTVLAVLVGFRPGKPVATEILLFFKDNILFVVAVSLGNIYF